MSCLSFRFAAIAAAAVASASMLLSQPSLASADEYGPDTCRQGFVWREAVTNDHVCVTPQGRTQARIDNAQASARRNPGGGAFGPDTCRQGFVWREAVTNDRVCVTPQARTQARIDNAQAALWVAPPSPSSIPSDLRPGTLTAMERCQSNISPDVSWPFTQDGSTNGVNFPVGPNPPNGISPGNVVRVLIDDNSKVRISYLNNESYGVDGKAEAATSGYPFPGWPKYGAYYRFNNNPGGWVASGSDPNPWAPHPLRELAVCTPAPNIPVRLLTQINDDNIGDNQSGWNFTLQIWR